MPGSYPIEVTIALVDSGTCRSKAGCPESGLRSDPTGIHALTDQGLS
jgi:hypothetical protein